MRTKPKRAIHVMPGKQGWTVRTAGALKSYRTGLTQEEAIQIGRRVAMNRGTELLVHRNDGSIRSKDTFPEPPPLFGPYHRYMGIEP